jgi:hypothetical protein
LKESEHTAENKRNVRRRREEKEEEERNETGRKE